MSQKNENTIKKSGLTLPAILFFAFLPVVAAFVALCIGRMSLSPRAVWTAILDFMKGVKNPNTVVVFNIRLPRILLALLSGAGLSAAGLTFQSLFQNPLATPDTVGISSGASFGAALAILFGFSQIGVQGLSFIAGLAAVFITYLTGSGKGKGMHSVVLAGIMVGSLFTALVSLVKFAADSESQLPSITYFLMGSLQSASYKNLLIGLVPMGVGFIGLFLLRWRLNLLPYSAEEVRSFGVNMKALRIVTALLATLLTASAVSLCGQVGWVGLLVPHMCRMKYKSDHRALLPASLSVGAAFLVVVDTLARSVSPEEIPVSVLTAIVGAPFFIYLMRKTGGWKL